MKNRLKMNRNLVLAVTISGVVILLLIYAVLADKNVQIKDTRLQEETEKNIEKVMSGEEETLDTDADTIPYDSANKKTSALSQDSQRAVQDNGNGRSGDLMPDNTQGGSTKQQKDDPLKDAQRINEGATVAEKQSPEETSVSGENKPHNTRNDDTLTQSSDNYPNDEEDNLGELDAA